MVQAGLHSTVLLLVLCGSKEHSWQVAGGAQLVPFPIFFLLLEVEHHLECSSFQFGTKREQERGLTMLPQDPHTSTHRQAAKTYSEVSLESNHTRTLQNPDVRT